jgi:uncharacterized membrane protein YeiH
LIRKQAKKAVSALIEMKRIFENYAGRNGRMWNNTMVRNGAAMEELLILLEMIGTAAFAVSGALTALRHKTDLLGVIMLGILTATGGGVIRDLLLGNVPPSAFTDSKYVFASALTSAVIFIIAKINTDHHTAFDSGRHRTQLFIMDTVGLSVFTAAGVLIAWEMFPDNGYLCVFSGVVSGVGGGLIRDIVVNELPYIFSRHIYAVASMAGGITEILLLDHISQNAAAIAAAAVIILIRIASARYHLNLPKIEGFEERDSHD